MDTLLLDQNLWDLCKTAGGDIAVASQPYAIAQDVASALRLFLGELWYDTLPGVPYFEEILGQNPPKALIKARLVAAARRVPQVVSAECFLFALKDRTLTGQVRVTFTDEASATIGFSADAGGIVTTPGG